MTSVQRLCSQAKAVLESEQLNWDQVGSATRSFRSHNPATPKVLHILHTIEAQLKRLGELDTCAQMGQKKENLQYPCNPVAESTADLLTSAGKLVSNAALTTS